MSIPSHPPRPVQQLQGPATLQALLDAAERRIIVRALEENGGARKRAAAQLGISRSTLFNKMRKHDLLDRPSANGQNGVHGEDAEEETPPARPLYIPLPPRAQYG